MTYFLITQIISFVLIFSILILLCFFFVHNGQFTLFLQRLIFLYFMYYIWQDTQGICASFFTERPRVDLSLKPVFFSHDISDFHLNIDVNNSLFFRLFIIYSRITVIIFFFGVAERFFISKVGILEFPVLILCLHFGGFCALRLYTIIDVLIALEIVTLASYIIVTFERQNRFSAYAGVQYFILGSLPSARLLLSFSFFYLQSGSLTIQDLDLCFNTIYNVSDSVTSTITTVIDLFEATDEISSVGMNTYFYNSSEDVFFMSDIENAIEATNPINSIIIIALLFFFFNAFFKITAAPFHMWAPSVYGKAPIASVAFLSIYSKVLIFFLLFKLLNTFLHFFSFFALILILFIGTISIFIGILGAFTEKMIKRFFVYSSIGHVGFILIGLALNTAEGYYAMFRYMFVYMLSSFIIWFFLLNIGRMKTYLSHFSEMKIKDPILVMIFAFLVFSISGIPPLGGFFIKLNILASLIDSSHFFITYILFFFSVVSFFYYLRLIKIRFFDYQENTLFITPITNKLNYNSEYPHFVNRIWIISVIIILLAFYSFFENKFILFFLQESVRNWLNLKLNYIFAYI